MQFRPVEAVIVGATLLSLVLLGRCYVLSLARNAGHSAVHAFHGGVVLTIWVLYWQVGFLLVKRMFVRWRMPLPANRRRFPPLANGMAESQNKDLRCRPPVLRIQPVGRDDLDDLWAGMVFHAAGCISSLGRCRDVDVCDVCYARTGAWRQRNAG